MHGRAYLIVEVGGVGESRLSRKGKGRRGPQRAVGGRRAEGLEIPEGPEGSYFLLNRQIRAMIGTFHKFSIF